MSAPGRAKGEFRSAQRDATPVSRRRQAAFGLGVLMAHAGLYAGLAAWLHKPPGLGQQTAAPTIAWIHRPPAAPQQQPATPATVRPAPATVRDSRPRPPGSALAAIHSTSDSAGHAATQAPADPPAGADTQALAAAPAPPAAASQATPPALNLTLQRRPAGPPSAAAMAAQDDHLRPRPSRDERLAQTLGTDTRLQETQRGDVRRFRQGRACIDVEPAREAGLNPFNQSVSATPRQARPC